MLTIRLSRIGKRKKPMYRLIISEKARDTYGKALEILGSYNPFSKELVVKKDRIEHWLNQGAQMSVTVNNLLIEKDIIKGKKAKNSKISKKRAQAKAAAEPKAEEKKEAAPAAPEAEEKPAIEEKKEEAKPEEAPATPEAAETK